MASIILTAEYEKEKYSYMRYISTALANEKKKLVAQHRPKFSFGDARLVVRSICANVCERV